MLRVLVAVLIWLGPAALRAQLVSPGPLSSAHAELTGLRRCTSCHELGARGAAPQRCLACHETVATRVAARRGYHATAEVQRQSCGSCHREHYGTDFDLVRFDTASFRHDAVGFTLRGAHVEAGCRTCHAPEFISDAAVRRERRGAAALARSFMGLPQQCVSCHRSDDPHGSQFGARECASCHAEDTWDEAARFDHDSVHRLTGAHRDAACSGCHRTAAGVTEYTGVRVATCTSCHTDVHRGAQRAPCSSCHTTEGWTSFAPGFDATSFNHATTRFPLRAAHARLDCARCHATPARRDDRIRITFSRAGGTYPTPAFANCRSCHVDAHEGSAGAAGSACTACHDEGGWTPVKFGIAEHARTAFPLDGAHLLASCAGCHPRQRPARLAFPPPPAAGCAACHERENPHGRAFADARGATDCARCHTSSAWTGGVSVQHERLPLDGGHAGVKCAACHTPERAAPPPVACAACHAASDPHAGRSAGRECEACHDVAGFAGARRFDHGTTRFTLEGAHVAAACTACHAREPGPGIVLRFSPLPLTCEGCHGP